MIISGRRLLLGLAIVIVLCAVIVWLVPEARWLSIVVAICGGLVALVVSAVRPSRFVGPVEAEDISDVPEQRRAELMRGTSKLLREMGYRYSVRLDKHATGDRRCFTAEVNSVRLGFVSALITDNATDRQGYGFVAFVYDNRRWRGPGLPCPAGQSEAIRHAAQCVSPLDAEGGDSPQRPGEH
ncbi:MAG: hypothetical protein ACYTGC_00275 [Planctomycetota bacterium]|jgi:hypothetical protein